ncbi:MAG: phytoene/squalene synthase family protein [Gammaproteobacteria bacterium]|nr:phytoene/squalene synthase family protein [Gammaproteobacteria bacterium]
MPASLSEEDRFDSADLAACYELLNAGSKSFYTASLLLPRKVRDAATALYAFCRVADDAIDQSDDCPRALAALRQRLDAIYRRRPHVHVADRAFADVIERYAIPRALPEALLEGFEWDAVGRRYRTLADVEAYGARVAGTVGAMMALLMGARDADVIARACDMGIAMQLTNIARDAGEDARAGRLYLPEEWLREAGIDPDAWLARPAYSAALGGVIERLVAHAESLYQRGRAGIAYLPPGCRPGMHAARLIYAEIGHTLVRSGSNSVTTRTVVPTADKLALCWRALKDSLAPRREVSGMPVLDANRFLVDAVRAAPLPAATTPAPMVPVLHRVEQRNARLVALFEQLQRDERASRNYLMS